MSLFNELDQAAHALVLAKKAEQKQAEEAQKKLEAEQKAKQEAHDHKDKPL